MLKRLLVAVFVLGLLLAFSGTAFSTDQLGRQPKSVLHPKPELNKQPNNRLGSVYPWNQVAPANHRALSTIRNAPGTEVSQATASPDTTVCGNIDYLHIPGFYTYIMQAGDWTDRVAISFDVPVNYQTTLSAVRLRTYEVVGSPSITVQIHSDNLGNPGAVVYSQTFGPFAPLAYPGHTKVLNLSTPQVFSGGSFWVSIGQTGLPTDSVGIGINRRPDSTTTGRGRYSLDGTNYMTFQGVGFALDWDPRIAVTRCQVYTSCYSNRIDPRGMYGVVMPDDGYPDGSTGIGIGQRFVASGPETLKSLKVLVVDEVAFGLPGHLLYGPTSTNGFVAKLWTDSSGSIDVSSGGTVIGSVPGGLANIFPTTNNNGSAAPLYRDTITIPVPSMPVLLGPYHITIEPTSINFADGAPIFRFGIDNTFGGGSVLFTAPGLTDWHLAVNDPVFCPYNTGLTPYDGSFDIRPQLCRDEFSICQNQQTYDAPQMWDYQMRLGSNIQQWAHLVKGALVNRVEKLRFQVYGVGTVGLTAKIWSKSLSGPGALLYSQAVASPTFNPGWTEVVIPGGIQVLGDFYIGYEGSFPNPATDTLWGETEDFYLAAKNGGAWLYYLPAGGWIPISTFGYEDNLMAEAEFCSVPVDERTCVTENDWPTFQHDFARSGASGVSLEDAYCDLNLNWSHIRPTGRAINLNGPIIWNGYVICAFSAATAGSYVIFDLATGAIIDEIDDPTWGADNSVIGGNIRCTPTIATIDIDPTAAVNLQPVLFIVGGNPGSMSAFDLSGGFPLAVPASKLWTFTDGGNIGATRYGNIIVQNLGGTDVAYLAADDNKVYAVNATTGASYAGWASPYTLAFNPQKSGATDGSNLFYSLFNPAGNGKITSLKLNNGTLAWDFTGLQGAVLFTGVVVGETFEAGVSTAGGELFANSRVFDGTPDVANLSRGVFYRLNTTTGAMISATAGERARTTTPTIDLNRVIVPNLPRVTGASATGGQVVAFSRLDGSIAYSTSSFFSAQNNGQMGYFVEGLLTCEPNTADLYYAFNIAGYLSCFNADNGNELYHRRVDHAGANQGGMGAIGKDGTGAAHLVYVDAFGGIYDMTKGADRPRLELLISTAAIAVPFGSPADTIVEFENVYTNTGCANLTVSLTASTTSNGTTVPAPGFSTINSRLNDASSSMADALTSNAVLLKSPSGVKYMSADQFGGSTDEVVTYADVRETYNQSAAAVPAFLNQNGGSYAGDVFDPAFGGLVLAPGDTAGIRVHANGPLVNRGPNSFYAEFTTHNDPDYYLDNPARRPELFLTLVGGCLLDTTTLHFGAASANQQHVYNTLRLGQGGTEGFTIDGQNNEILYQGFISFGVAKHRQAINSNKWDNTPNEWISIQADPNYCDASCKPAITTGVALGAITADGLVYTPISGTVVCQSFIDSVQNHDLGAGWDWDNHAAPFDNDSTMGLSANTKVIGVVNAPNVGNGLLLNNMTINIMTFKERNGNPVPGWKLLGYVDHDIAGRDTAYFDASHSVGWGTGTTAGTDVSGFIKVPFGCGYTGMKSNFAANQTQISFIPDWDTLWIYAEKPAGTRSMDYTGTGDQGSGYAYDEYDFPAGGTHEVGVAYFAFHNHTPNNSSTGKIANLATLVNQWAGFGRGDVNNDGVINIADVVYLASNVNFAGPGPKPFAHIGDVDANGVVNMADVTYLVNYYFSCGPCPLGEFVL